jgi:hypothetical protein
VVYDMQHYIRGQDLQHDMQQDKGARSAGHCMALQDLQGIASGRVPLKGTRCYRAAI